MTDEPLKCPYCGGAMVSGKVSIRGRLIDFLIFGLGSQQLWFAPDSDPTDARRNEETLRLL